MNIVVFDTETTSLEKPFCYNVGYAIIDTESKQVVCAREFVIEQVWSNTALFASAYYADKRPLYVGRMRARTVLLKKWGYVTQQMIRDFESYEITQAYAYNSSFDERVFAFNCEWFKTINPFETVKVFDIRGYVHQFIAYTHPFQEFCEKHTLFTESGNYSTTAETLFRYVSNQLDFDEEHTALADTLIEAQILFECVRYGAEYGVEYKTYNSIPRKVERELIVRTEDREIVFKYTKRTNRGNTIILK